MCTQFTISAHAPFGGVKGSHSSKARAPPICQEFNGSHILGSIGDDDAGDPDKQIKPTEAT